MIAVLVLLVTINLIITLIGFLGVVGMLKRIHAMVFYLLFKDQLLSGFGDEVETWLRASNEDTP